jgi:hypothetical protein
MPAAPPPLLHGTPTSHLAATVGLCVLLLVALNPLDMRLFRRRVFGDR